MKIWEAIQMLEQMDNTKECTVTFGTAKQTKVPPLTHREWVIGRGDWVTRTAAIDRAAAIEQGIHVH